MSPQTKEEEELHYECFLDIYLSLLITILLQICKRKLNKSSSIFYSKILKQWIEYNYSKTIGLPPKHKKFKK